MRSSTRARRSRIAAATAAIVVSLFVALLGSATTSAPVAAVESGTYSAPTRYPLRGTSQVGCTWSNGCNGHHSYFALDLLQAKGSPVYPAGAGKLTIKGTRTDCSSAAGYGTWVEVDHGNGVTTRYAHLSRITVASGSWVDETTKIGEVGATGSVRPCTANHLHYEERLNGVGVAPRALQACDGKVYPTTWGVTGWNEVPAFTKSITAAAGCSATPPTTTTTTPPTTPWQTVAGTLIQVDMGPNGQVWGVDASGRLLEMTSLGQWAVRGTGFRWVSVGQAPDAGGPFVYALTTSGAIRRSRNGTTWESLSGTLVQIDHGPQGEIWGVNAAGNLYQYAGRNKWTLRGTGYRAVTVGRAEAAGRPYVYALTTAGAIRGTANGVDWQAVAGTLVQIDHGPQGELWGVNAAGNLYRRLPDRWSKEDTGFRHVSVGGSTASDGTFVYAVRTDGSVRRRG